MRKLTRRLIGQLPVTLGFHGLPFLRITKRDILSEAAVFVRKLHEQSEYSTNCKCCIPSVSATLISRTVIDTSARIS